MEAQKFLNFFRNFRELFVSQARFRKIRRYAFFHGGANECVDGLARLGKRSPCFAAHSGIVRSTPSVLYTTKAPDGAFFRPFWSKDILQNVEESAGSNGITLQYVQNAKRGSTISRDIESRSFVVIISLLNGDRYGENGTSFHRVYGFQKTIDDGKAAAFDRSDKLLRCRLVQYDAHFLKPPFLSEFAGAVPRFVHMLRTL